MRDAGYMEGRQKDSDGNLIALLYSKNAIHPDNVAMGLYGVSHDGGENFQDIYIQIGDVQIPYDAIQMQEYVHPDTLRKGVAFIDTTTSVRYQFENIKRGDTCPICQSIDIDSVYHNGKRTGRICESCGHHF